VLASRLSRSWSATLDQVRRDVTMLKRRLSGDGPPPVLRDRAARSSSVDVAEVVDLAPRALAAVPAPSLAERELVVRRVVRETADATTLVLADPSSTEQRDDPSRDAEGPRFAFLPGQFFTVLTAIDGTSVPRNYSASNRPGERDLCLTIKRKAGGRVSERLVGTRAGDRVRVLGPFGSFTVRQEAGRRRTLVLVAGGVGITPLMSIARTILAAEPESEIALLYGNRRAEDIVFAASLASLVRAYSPRFSVLHALEEPPREWQGAVGRLDQQRAGRLLDRITLASRPDTEFFVCGPTAMQTEVLAALAERGVERSRIKTERFTIASSEPRRADGQRTRLTLAFAGRTVKTTALPGATLLETGLAAGVPMPYSCAVGGCGACRVRLVSGEVDMEEPHCLSDAEREAGFVLACVGRARGSCTLAVTRFMTPEGVPEMRSEAAEPGRSVRAADERQPGGDR
jgi:ring-1,2-phenylacetyl-CoA epoxidase subunit PaaE